VALLRKVTCNLGHPMHFRHPVDCLAACTHILYTCTHVLYTCTHILYTCTHVLYTQNDSSARVYNMCTCSKAVHRGKSQLHMYTCCIHKKKTALQPSHVGLSFYACTRHVCVTMFVCHLSVSAYTHIIYTCVVLLLVYTQ